MARYGPRHRDFHDEELIGKVYDADLVRRVLPHLKPHVPLLAVSLTLLLFVSAAQLIQPFVLMLVIDGPLAERDVSGLLPLALFYALAVVSEFLFRFGQMYSMERTGQKVIRSLRTTLYGHVQRLPATFLDRNPIGRLVTRLTGDVENLSELFSSGIVTLLGDSVKLIGIVGILLWMDLKLAALTLAVLPALAGFTFFFRVRIRDAFRAVRERVARLNAFLQEQITGMAVVQLFQRESANDAEFDEVNRRHLDADLASVGWDSSFSALIELMGSVTVAAILWYGGIQVISEAITFGILVAFIEYVHKFFGPIRELGGYYTVMQSAMASSERIFALLDEPTESTGGRTLPEGLDRGAIRLDGVRFAYAGGKEVLSDLHLDIRAGERIAIVGSTGSGKTTLARLLLRLYEPSAGSITMDGVDLRDLCLKDLRRRTGVVLQEPFLFAGTIADNISLGDPSISRERVIAAARAVSADRFIETLPGGYDAEVREAGSNLSVGQKQLLCFARILAFDPPVLILDEATSSVDSATERVVQKAFRRLTRGRSCLIIAHRLSTIRDCDRIVVLHKGRVREEGSHEDLLRLEGIYAAFHRLQTRLAPPGAGRSGEAGTGP
jgi:ATP-binding cassette subfamily B protein